MAQDAGVVRAHWPVDPQPAAVFTIALGLDRPVARRGFLSMKWMLLLVLVVIGVETLMGTTAPPVL